MYMGEKDCLHLFFWFQFAKEIWATQKIPLGGYFFRGGLLGIVPGQSFQEGGRKGKACCCHVDDMAASE